jgi:cysteine desulfurase
MDVPDGLFGAEDLASNLAYLDHAATTPLRPAAREAMLPWLGGGFGNPSGAHAVARAARKAIDEARDEIAELLGCAPNEIVFTGGGTEADNLAVQGVAAARPGPVLCSAVEHHAVLHPVEHVGGKTVPVDGRGVLDLDALADALDAHPGTALVSVMAANNEVGALQPLAEVAQLVRRRAPNAVVHTDAVQATAWLDPTELTATVDLLSASAHKFGGPQGVGVLVVRRGTPLEAQLLGGGQERELRSGTHNVAGIVGMAAALADKAALRTAESDGARALRDRLADGLLTAIPGASETAVPDGAGPVGTGLAGAATTAGALADAAASRHAQPADDPDRRAHLLPGTLHITIPGAESEALLFLLDEAGVCASAASACASGAQEASHVLAAMGVPPDPRRGALRLSLGWTSTDADVDRVLEVLPPIVERLRSADINQAGQGAPR